MKKYYTKECPYEGIQQSVPKSNGVLNFSIPQKCDGCEYYFEGKCRKVTNRLVRLDFGFCGIEGSKELVEHEATSRGIPKKCKECPFLESHKHVKLVCGKDKEIWGDMPRGLDC